MKVVILAGGLGTRISEESHLKPKPMIAIGDQPILWHIMKYYSMFGFEDFILCCGYKGYIIKEYFADYYLHRSDVTFDFSAENQMIVHSNVAEPWRVTLVDTGLHTQTGGRIKRVEKYRSDELFKGNLAMLPQDPQSLFVKKTVREDLEEMLVSRDDAGDVERVAGICDITHLLDSHPYDLSGGEQQRAALAKVLLTRPKILLLDEPTKGIDNFFKLQLADILKKLREDGVTILMVSHDVEFCAKYADLAGMFFDGGVITVNTPRKFFSQNSFYTTAANRMSRHVFKNAITNEDVIELCQKNR